jgi:hypothetical protein
MRAEAISKTGWPLVALGSAAVAAGNVALAQPAFEPIAHDAAQAQIVEQLQENQARDGIDSEKLIVPLTDLALLYEQTGLHALANAAIDQALYIMRVNNGLHSLDQAPLLRQAIGNDEASGDLAAAWKREQELVALARRHPDDVRTVSIFREVADHRMAVFEAWMAGEYPEQMLHGDYCESIGQIFSCSRREAALAVVGDAQMYYADAIEVLLRNELYSDVELPALEAALVRTSDLVRQRPEQLIRPGPTQVNVLRAKGRDEAERYGVGASEVIFRDETAARLEELSPKGARYEPAIEVEEEPSKTSQDFPSYYLFGRQSLVRLYKYAVASSAPVVEEALALVELADWDLLYSHNSMALEEYAQVYARLQESDAGQAVIEELFSPRIPIVLPVFLPPLTYEQTEASTDYIDVAFRISKLGEPQRVEVLETSSNVTDPTTEHLVRVIKTNRFRPRLMDGEFRTSSVVVRFYVDGR